MKILCRELMKLARQFHGSENIFGYKSTVANQIYLFYCFSGKIYFTDKIDKRVKYLWCGIVSCQVLLSYVIGGTYLWSDDVSRNDLIMMFNVGNAVGNLHATAFVVPLISFLYRNSIETMIDRVDSILTINGVSDSNQKKVQVDAKNNFLSFFGLLMIFMTINFSICFFDVVLLFEESKVENYLYYGLPVFLIRKYSSMGSFFIVNGILTISFMMLMVQGWMGLGVISYWSTVWYNELMALRDELNSAMRDLNAYFGEDSAISDDWNKTFERVLKRSIGKFRKITLLIDDMRGCFEVYGTLFVCSLYFFNLVVLYFIVSSDFSAVLMVKYVAACVSSIVVVFLFYWIGQNLENSVTEVSMAIYSTPWYRSVKVRKNVYIFMNQTESVKNFTIFKVYWLLLNNFSRYAHSVVSYTNVLLKLTKK